MHQSSGSELVLRPFESKDYAECRELFSAGMLELIIPHTKNGIYTYLPYALAMLVPISVMRWSVFDILVYLGICVILIVKLHFQACEKMTNYVRNGLNTDLLDISKYYKDGSCMFVAELNGKIVGMCAVINKHQHKEGEAELVRLSVSSTMRKQGIGKKLITIIEGYCKEHKYNKLILLTSSSQYAALCLYEKCGFKVIERKAHELHGVELVTYAKDIKIKG